MVGHHMPHLMYYITLVLVEVFGQFQAEESPSIRLEMAGLNWVLRIKGWPPVIQQTSPVYYDKTFNVIKRPPQRY